MNLKHPDQLLKKLENFKETPWNFYARILIDENDVPVLDGWVELAKGTRYYPVYKYIDNKWVNQEGVKEEEELNFNI